MTNPSILEKNTQITIENMVDRFKFLYVKAIRREDNFTTYFKDRDYAEPSESSRIYFQNTLQSLQAAIHGTGVIAANIHFLENEIEDGLLVKVVNETVTTRNAFYLVNPEETNQREKVQVFKQWLLSEITT